MFCTRGPCRLLAALVCIVACYSSQSLHIPQPTGRLETNPLVVNVTRQDESVVEVYGPRVKGDSLVGWLDNPDSEASNVRRVALNLSDIRWISTERFDAVKSIGAVVSGGVLLVSVFAMLMGVGPFAGPNP
jgi:hypothetical protein